MMYTITMTIRGECDENKNGGYKTNLACGSYQKNFTGDMTETTLGRACLQAIIAGLEAITAKDKVNLKIVSSSGYVAKGLKNYTTWKANNWTTMRDGHDVANKDQWQIISDLINSKVEKLSFQKIGNEWT